MTTGNDDLKVVWGAKAIARAINRAERQTYYLSGVSPNGTI